MWSFFALVQRAGARETGLPILSKLSEVESSMTPLASRTHFEVLGLEIGLEGQVHGLEASSPRKLLNAQSIARGQHYFLYH